MNYIKLIFLNYLHIWFLDVTDCVKDKQRCVLKKKKLILVLIFVTEIMDVTELLLSSLYSCSD